jgi:ABC-type amino acid transport system permease subunit
MQPDSLDQRPDWLRLLAEKTWNLELIISGAAIFLASYLPDLVDEALRLYQTYFAPLYTNGQNVLPLLAYSFFKIVAWLLPATFVLHFVMRAFWASLVGLHTAFPSGIRYDQVPNTSPLSREVFARSYGTLDQYIQRIDRYCNQIFAFAFMLALFGVGLGTVYLLIFVFNELLPLWVGPTWGRRITQALSTAFSILVGLVGVIQLLSKRYSPPVGHWLHRVFVTLFRVLPQVFLPFLSRPMSIVSMTFSSNVSRKRYYFGFLVVLVGIFATFFVTIRSTMLHMRGGDGQHTQQFFSKSATRYHLQPSHYDDTDSRALLWPRVTVPSEAIEGPWLRVFVAYPKWLDDIVARQCDSLPVLSDSLPRRTYHTLTDSLHIACFRQAVRLSINDSVYRDAEFVFQKHPKYDLPGLVTYLPTRHFHAGQNLLIVRVPSAERADSLMVYDEVPFWF